MISGVSTSSQELDLLKAQMQAIKEKRDAAKDSETEAEDTKTSADSTKTDAEQVKTNADSAKDIAQTQKSIADTVVQAAEASVGLAKSELDVANNEVQGALSVLQSAQSADPVNENTVASAQAAYDRAIANQQAAQNALKEANEALDKAKEAQKKAEEALDKCTQEAQDAETALNEASSALDKAIDELEEAVETLEDAETERVEKEEVVDEVESNPIMSEEQAINEGYTIIKSYEDLLKIGNDMNGKYMLMGNIRIPEGVNWSPIGNSNSPFTGTFDGNGCQILGLNIDVDSDEAENIGFFGAVEEAKISNLTFKDAKINGKTDYLTGTTNAGVLAGLVRNSQIDNCHVKDSEVKAYAAAGGLIGAVDDSNDKTTVSEGNTTITGCSTDVDVESMYFAGGLLGYVTACDDRSEDHRGIVNKSLIVRDCHAAGSATAGEESVGGLIGETDKTLVTIDKCSSDMDLYWSNPEDDSDLSFLLETGRIGGLVGNVNGTYITFANCDFDGTLNGDTEFQSEVYGWYMDDSHVCMYDLPAGLPVDDILNISGVDGMTLGNDGRYECTVSTLSGLDKMVSMIKENPSLADQVVFNVNFDFNAMDGQYTYSEYAQYGVVQHLYEDEDGKVHNDVYIDNECDLESTYHAAECSQAILERCESDGSCNGQCMSVQPTMVSGLYKTMVPGLEKDQEINYYVDTDEGLKEVTLKINADDQITDVKTRLTESEVRYRDNLVEMGKKIQQNMRDILKRMFNYDSDESVPILTKAEYKKLVKKAEKYGYDSLSDKEKLGMAVFEVDYDIMNAQADYTKNLGCGMGGNASFLDKTTTYQMYDDEGRALYTTLDGDSLIMDENGHYAYADGSGAYYGMAEVFEQRGYQSTDDDGNLLFSDADGNTITKIKDKDGNESYVTTDENGEQIPYEGDTESLTKQLTEANYASDYENFGKDLEQIQKDIENGKYPKSANSEKDKDDADSIGTDIDTNIDTNVDTDTDDKKKKEETI